MATKTKTTKADFCRSFEWSKGFKLEWFDTTGIVALPGGDRIVKVELAGSSDYYRFDVSIVNKLSGIIDSKSFLFDDHLDITQRADDRAMRNSPNYYKAAGYRVVPHCGMEWYIAVPTSTRSLTSAIELYVAKFRWLGDLA